MPKPAREHLPVVQLVPQALVERNHSSLGSAIVGCSVSTVYSTQHTLLTHLSNSEETHEARNVHDMAPACLEHVWEKLLHDIEGGNGVDLERAIRSATAHGLR